MNKRLAHVGLIIMIFSIIMDVIMSITKTKLPIHLSDYVWFFGVGLYLVALIPWRKTP